MEITLNQAQRLFILKASDHVSCLGFQVVYEQSCELVRRLQKAGMRFDPLRWKTGEPLEAPSTAEIGTEGQYRLYEALLAAYARLGDNDTWYEEATPAAVRKVLEAYRKTGGRIRVFYGDQATGRDWLEEFETVGSVSRSTGTLKVPLLVVPGQGGASLLPSSIVRMQDPVTGRELYRHPAYHVPEMDLRLAESDARAEGFTHTVWVKSAEGRMVNHANFPSLARAAHWIAFMCGESQDIKES